MFELPNFCYILCLMLLNVIIYITKSINTCLKRNRYHYCALFCHDNKDSLFIIMHLNLSCRDCYCFTPLMQNPPQSCNSLHCPGESHFESGCVLSPVSLAGALLPRGLSHAVQSLLQQVLPEGLSHLRQRIHCGRSDELISMQHPGVRKCFKIEQKKKRNGPVLPAWL